MAPGSDKEGVEVAAGEPGGIGASSLSRHQETKVGGCIIRYIYVRIWFNSFVISYRYAQYRYRRNYFCQQLIRSVDTVN